MNQPTYSQAIKTIIRQEFLPPFLTIEITLSPRDTTFTPTISTDPTVTRLSTKGRRKKFCRYRDIHTTMFFLRPGYVPPEHKKSKKVIKKKRVFLSDKETRQWAREHWTIWTITQDHLFR